VTDARFYTGRGARDPNVADRLPTVDPSALRRPNDYLATPELAAAVDVALTLGMPLLLTGEPGSGKSGLADSVAWEFGFGKALSFVVKSDTEARDLFYRFDTVGRFHASQTKDADADPRNFIRFEALGKAILHAKPESYSYSQNELGLPRHAVDHPGKQRRSVVLIDEIDKAPRDVPNDILVEIDNMQFDIPEISSVGLASVRVTLDEEEQENRYRPIVIFTSNREKALPDPFLRRCVYYHLEFPPFETDLPAARRVGRVTVDSIVSKRLGGRYPGDTPTAALVEKAIGFFRHLRSAAPGLGRIPTLAELLNWLDYLMPERQSPAEWSTLAAIEKDDESDGAERLRAGVATLLLKKSEDQERARELLADWRAIATGDPD
jgi:MoxR-like ATPase